MNSKFFKHILLTRYFLKRDLVICFLIVLAPFAFFCYTIVPKNTQTWETVIGSINSSFFEQVDILFWYFSGKILILTLLILWYLTCQHWWKHILIIPILVENFRLTSFLLLEFKVDYNAYLISPITTIFILILLELIARKTKYDSNSINSKINKELIISLNLIAKLEFKDYMNFKRQIGEIRKQKEQLGTRDYLRQLIALREQFTRLLT